MTVVLAPAVLAALAAGALGRAAGAARAARVRGRLARASAATGSPRLAGWRSRHGAGLAAAAGLAVLGSAVAGPGLAVLAVAGAVGAFAVRGRLADARAAAAAADALPEAVDALARALRAGVPPAVALATAADGAPPLLAEQLLGCSHAVERGMTTTAALDRWATTTAIDGVGLLAGSAAVVADVGGEPARAMARVADTLRERRALRREVRALSAQARASAAVVAVAPLGFAVVMAATDEATAAFLFGSPAGLACVVVGLGLELAGWRWMQHIVGAVQ